ncbi:RNA methyltransferase [Bombilactobacillus bombi]|uniref:TrmH family RNA methyltransferase n=1 Tax=Bombilactobacillus bombi TaxID=1303590 RepID=UPI000E579A33|nr:RNA methyltransferase [Bombilactobacillus bombi]AXX64303.1 RNA methyltransferase [Bombilactobacillus bombi]
MEYITSVKNEKIKEIKKLANAKGRRQQQRYLIEGEHLVHEALINDIVIEELLVTENFLNHDEHHLVKQLYDQCVQIGDSVAKHLSATVTPQGIFAVVALPPTDPNIDYQGKWLLLDRIQDPGNVGTMIRTADAAGYQGVILSKDSADLFAPKVQRSMQGSQFHLQLLTANLQKIITSFKQNRVTVYGTLVNEQARDYHQVQAPKNLALIMGNEAQGMNNNLAQLADENLYIPLIGQAESLNVAIAAGILMFNL